MNKTYEHSYRNLSMVNQKCKLVNRTLIHPLVLFHHSKVFIFFDLTDPIRYLNFVIKDEMETNSSILSFPDFRTTFFVTGCEPEVACVIIY